MKIHWKQMGYYNTAVLLSWLVVSSSLCIVAAERGIYQAIPFYLTFAAFGGIVPALVCAWALRILGKLSGVNRFWIWVLRGGYLGIGYVLMSDIVFKYFPVHASIDSVKGFLYFLVFGSAILMKIKPVGLLITAFAGAINGAVLHRINRRK